MQRSSAASSKASRHRSIAKSFLVSIVERGKDILELALIVADGRRIAVEMLARTLDHDGETAIVTAMRDVTERKEAQEHIRYLVQHDALTRLSNRTSLRERLDKAIEWARHNAASESHHTALLRVNIDRFRIVNDVHGSSVGDRVLKLIADRLH